MTDGKFSRNINGYFSKIKHRFLLTIKCDKTSCYLIYDLLLIVIKPHVTCMQPLGLRVSICTEAEHSI